MARCSLLALSDIDVSSTRIEQATPTSRDYRGVGPVAVPLILAQPAA